MEKFNFKSIEVAYNEEHGYIYVNYSGASQSEDFRAAWDKTIELLKKHEATKWLINQKKQSIYPDDQTWLSGDWFPRSMAALPPTADKPRFVATIQAENFFTEFSTSKFIKENSSDVFKINVFRTEDEAVKWLDECTVAAV